MNDTALRFPPPRKTAVNVGLGEHVAAADLRRQYAAQVITTELALAVIDVISLTLAALTTITLYLAFGGSLSDHLSAFACGAFVLLAVFLFRSFGLYKPGIQPVLEVRNLLTLIATASLLGATHLYVAGQTWQIMLCFLPLAAIVVPVARSCGRSLLARQHWWGVRCLVFGANRRIESLYHQHLGNATTGLKPTGFLQDSVPSNCSKHISRCFRGHAHHTSHAAAAMGVS